ncbi:hypothetical protein [Sulfuritalea sp.]|uniref:hypothetical protein n=1 Tax=Sulfuritalea sp. TaxID=2480090 RepID=UPI001AC2A385|nr:hypothetical protein [Sulfuritalea sp.]MBN8474060.1 hypothetical protein [Sulfuritalea sp.]
MKLFNRLPGFTPATPGLERRVLRALPTALWAGSLLLCLPSIAIRAWSWLTGAPADTPPLMMVDIYVASAIILHWTALFTAAIAAFIVMIMKGPAFVADAYPLIESDTPQCR